MRTLYESILDPNGFDTFADKKPMKAIYKHFASLKDGFQIKDDTILFDLGRHSVGPSRSFNKFDHELMEMVGCRAQDGLNFMCPAKGCELPESGVIIARPNNHDYFYGSFFFDKDGIISCMQDSNVYDGAGNKWEGFVVKKWPNMQEINKFIAYPHTWYIYVFNLPISTEVLWKQVKKNTK